MNFLALYNKFNLVITDQKLNLLCSIHENSRIKGGQFDENGVFIYTTYNHMKYCLPKGFIYFLTFN
jgi:coatomer protein complex subunit alpha (xenin)